MQRMNEEHEASLQSHANQMNESHSHAVEELRHSLSEQHSTQLASMSATHAAKVKSLEDEVIAQINDSKQQIDALTQQMKLSQDQHVALVASLEKRLNDSDSTHSHATSQFSDLFDKLQKCQLDLEETEKRERINESAHKRDIQLLTRDREADVANLVANASSMQQHMEDQITQLKSTVQQQQDSMQTLIDEHSASLEKQSSSHKSALTKLQTQLDASNNELQQMKTESEQNSDTASDLSEQLKSLSAKHKDALAQVENTKFETIAELQRKHESQVNQLTQMQDDKLEQVQLSHSHAIETINQRMTQQKAAFDDLVSQHSTLQQAHDQSQSELTASSICFNEQSHDESH